MWQCAWLPLKQLCTLPFWSFMKLFFAVLFFVLGLSYAAHAQQPAKVRKPVKNPPQYPHIIDLEGKQPQQTPQTTQPETPQPAPTVQTSDALVRAVEMLAGEVRTLVGEMRSLNLRQQAQVELTRMTRLDLRIDHYERELKALKDRIAALEIEEQQLTVLITPEGLMAQTAKIATLDREATMRQIKQQQEYRLRLVQAEKERLRQQEADLTKDLTAVRTAGAEAEQRIKQTEAQLKGNAPQQN
jgi:hypothetical protein